MSENTNKIKSCFLSYSVRPILSGNCAFPKYLHTRKLGESEVYEEVNTE